MASLRGEPSPRSASGGAGAEASGGADDGDDPDGGYPE
jgi:hypothetical protein